MQEEESHTSIVGLSQRGTQEKDRPLRSELLQSKGKTVHDQTDYVGPIE